MFRKLLSVAAVAMALAFGMMPSESEAGYYRYSARGQGYGRVYVRGGNAAWNRGTIRFAPGYGYSGGYVRGGFYAPRIRYSW